MRIERSLLYSLAAIDSMVWFESIINSFNRRWVLRNDSP
jgi:hypothetical protein